MSDQTPLPDAAHALAYMGKTVLVELQWDDEPRSYWYRVHVVGVVLPMAGVFDEAYFMTKAVDGPSPYPDELFFSDIRSIRAIRH